MRFNSFDELCAHRKIEGSAILPDVSRFPEKHQTAVLSYAKLILLSEELNEGHVFDWNDDDEYKWLPWFDLEAHKKNNPTGFRFTVSFFDCTFTCTAGGSRLCYRSSADSDFAGKTWTDLFRGMMVVPK